MIIKGATELRPFPVGFAQLSPRDFGAFQIEVGGLTFQIEQAWGRGGKPIGIAVTLLNEPSVCIHPGENRNHVMLTRAFGAAPREEDGP